MMGATSEEGTAYPGKSTEFTPGFFCGGRGGQSLVF